MSEAGGEEIPRTVTEDTGLTPKEETKDEEKKKEGAKDEEKKKEGANDDEKKKEEDEVKRTDNEAEVTGDELKNEANVVQHSIPEENVRQKPREIEVNQPSLEDTEAPTTTTIRTDEKDSSSGADAVDKPEKKDLKSKGDDGQEEEMDEKAKDANAEETKDERKSNDALADKGESSPTTLTMSTSKPTETTSPSTTTTTNVPSDETTKSSTTSTRTIAEPSSTPTPSSHVSTESTASTAESNSNPSDEYAEHITYTTDGNAIYTDPKTKHKYKWCPKENNWIYWTSAATTATTTGDENPYENEHYKWCSERNEWIPKAQKTDATTHTATAVTHTQSQTETEHYKWDAKKNAWIPKVQQQQSEIGTSATVDNGDGEATVKATTATTTTTGREDVTYGIDEDGQRIYTDRDGAVFFWDATKSAWFPKIDDDFMARYQMNYGFIDNTSASEAERRQREEAEAKRKALELQQMAEEARAATEAAAAGGGQVGVGAGVGVGGKRKAPPEPPKWFELNPEQNTKVYVSNLPLDITLDEFAEVMSKCGMIMRDPQTQKYKLKLYTEADGQIKGDGLCDYIKVESVELALKILDEYEVRGHKIRVQRAKFQMRGEYNPALKPKRKKKDKEKLQKMKEKLFDWRPEKMRGERSKNEKVVIIKNLFTPEIFEKEVQLILDYQNDLREECSKCGTVRKVVIYDLHAEGVAQVNMSSPEEADLVIQMMQGRFFGKRQLTAEHWDGKTKYKIAETENAVKSRLSNWDQFLETDEDKQQEEPVVAATPTATEEDK